MAAVVSPTAQMNRSELLQCFRDYSDYDLVGSVERCRAFIKAARMLLATPVTRSASQIRGEEVELDLTQTQQLLQKAEGWHATHGRTGEAALPRQFVIDDGWRDA